MQLEKEAEIEQLLDKQHTSLMELLLKQQQFLQMQAYMAQKQQQQYKMLMAILEKKIEKNEG